MKRIMLGLAALVLVGGGLFASSAEAARSRGGSRSHGHARVVHHGHHGHQQHRFHGSIHRGYSSWGRVYYNSRYRCNWYYNTGCGCWYYYYAPQQCYLPVRYIAQFPPG